jgi:ketosteroid isomerase-like protein
MADAAESLVLAFNEAINARDIDQLTSLMTDDHRFIDSAGAVVAGKQACAEAWRGFFAAFPDYRNVFTSVSHQWAGVVEIVGSSECSEPVLAGPARWRVIVVNGLVDEWRVFEAG